MNKVIQAKAINLCLNIKDVFLLQYLKEQYFYSNTFTSSEITNENPLLETKDIKESLEKLVNASLITMLEEWNRGAFKIQFNLENIKSLYKIEDVEIKKEKTRKPKKVDSLDSKPEIQNIVNFYKTMVFLPQIGRVTDRIVAIVEEKLNSYSPDDIKEALRYANDQQWLRSKANENWCTFNWVMNKIEEFMKGGKYRNRQEIRQESIIPATKVSVIL